MDQVDAVLAEELFEEHKHEARYRVNCYARRWPYRFQGHDPKEIENDFLYVIWQCSREFDPSRGVPFIKFAMQRITWAAWRIFFPERNHVRIESLDSPRHTQDKGHTDFEFTLADVIDDQQAAQELSGADLRLLDRIYEVRELVEHHPKLKDVERECLRLQFIRGLSRRATAKKLNLSDTYVSTNTHSGIRKIAAAMGADPKNVLKRRPNVMGIGCKAPHTRWHLGRGIKKPGCPFCEEAVTAR